MNISFSLPVSILREGDYFVAYSSALDLSTSAKTFEKAKRRFDEIVRIFFEELRRKNTTEEVLMDLGWEKFSDGEWSPPSLVAREQSHFQVVV